MLVGEVEAHQDINW